MKKALTLAAGFLLLALVFVVWWNSRPPKPIELIPALTGEPEYCLTCHADLPEISSSHPVKTFGCVICHGGERLALDGDLAHNTMRGGANPSDLSVVEASCGGSSCHSGSAAEHNDHIQRVMTSIQSTYAGAITNILYTLGAQPDLTARYGVYAVTDDAVTTTTGLPALKLFDPAKETNPILKTFAQNCLNCHVNAQPRAGDQFARLTGCAACHTPSQPFPNLQGLERSPRWNEGGEVHTLTTAISYTQCNACHNLGNYDLRTMTFVERTDQPTDRLHDYYQPIAQFTQCEYTLDCVDCHTRVEAMGDGDLYSNEKEVEYVQCKTCHGTPTQLPLTRTLTDPNDIAFRLAQLNPVIDLQVGDTILVTEKDEPLWNTRFLPDGTYEMTGKVTKQHFIFRPVIGSGCTQNGVDQSSSYCHTCHAVER